METSWVTCDELAARASVTPGSARRLTKPLTDWKVRMPKLTERLSPERGALRKADPNPMAVPGSAQSHKVVRVLANVLECLEEELEASKADQWSERQRADILTHQLQEVQATCLQLQIEADRLNKLLAKRERQLGQHQADLARERDRLTFITAKLVVFPEFLQELAVSRRVGSTGV